MMILSNNSELSEFRHLDGYYGTLVAFIAQAATGTVLCLLEVFSCQQSEYDGNAACGVQPGYACRYALTDVVEMGRLATDD
jgi:hypothetical protein